MSADVEHVTCRQLVEVLTDYLDGTLDAAERADIERHIVFCRGCADYVEQMHSTIDLLGLLSADTPEGAPNEGLVAIFRDWRAQRGPGAGAGARAEPDEP
jgi:anti-sigma factor RsiW